MRHRTLTLTVLLEFYALILSIVQYAQGLRTDEAKYLLDIPYPHPPLLRTFMGWTAHLPLHEFVWRFLLASALVQMFWLFVNLGSVLTPARRRALLLAWLFSSALLLHGGTVMMTIPVTCFAVVFLWCALRPVPLTRPGCSVLALAWLSALFVAYQSILFLPLVVAALYRSRVHPKLIILYTVLPVVLLLLYTMTNPLAVASLLNVAGQGAAPVSAFIRVRETALILLLAGSAVLTLTGLIGILGSRRLDLVLSFALVFGYTVVSTQQYYAILFTPLLVGGTFLLLCKRKLRPSFLALAHMITALFAAWMYWPDGTQAYLARRTMDTLDRFGIQGTVIIDGPFGHEWKYEAGEREIVRFTQTLSMPVEENAKAFICAATDCSEHVNTDRWVRLQGGPLPTWTRRGGL